MHLNTEVNTQPDIRKYMKRATIFSVQCERLNCVNKNNSSTSDILPMVPVVFVPWLNSWECAAYCGYSCLSVGTLLALLACPCSISDRFTVKQNKLKTTSLFCGHAAEQLWSMVVSCLLSHIMVSLKQCVLLPISVIFYWQIIKCHINKTEE